VKIFFWSADSSGCAYFRCELPAGELAKRGHDTLVSTVMPDEWLRTADVVVGQRVCQPGPTIRWQELAREGRAKLVLEIDDNLLAVDHSNGPAWSFFSQPGILDNLISNVKVADLVTVSTEPLAQVMRRLNPNVGVLPNCVPASLLDRPPHDHGGVVIGWSGGASHPLDLIELGDAPRRLLHRYPDVSLHTMGDAQAGAMMSKWNRDRVKWTPWIQTVPEFHETIDFDITLAPLRPSTFNQSKSPIRCLEAAALGIPVVASDFGPYSDFVRDGETGFLASRPHQWTGYLTKLLDPFLRREMGAKARAVAAEHTIESNAHLWETALCEH
jgi:glycosyltransferase involved in cell wall biosynthesis